MFPAAALLSLSLAAFARAQQIGTQTPEVHPSLTWQTCTADGSCTNNDGSVVLDANWRWLHTTSGYTNCYTGNTWDTSLCPDPTTCASNCALDGADYTGTYGVTTTGNSLKLNFVTNGANKNVGSRLYLMASDTEYEMFKLLNQEFTFDVDVSNLGCGLNGALYFSEMDADGGVSKYPTNKAGAQYGTGYCDSQCPRDLKFINGAANVLNWTADANSANSGTGEYGSCCNEMDVWEANSFSAAYTPHPCSVDGQTQCSGDDCGSPDRYAGVCDPDGCDFNSFRMGDTTFYGSGMTVDTTQPFTVVTQFLTSDNTTTGTLSEIRRIYVQNGKVIQNSNSNIAGVDAVNSITEDFCTQQKTAFGDTNDFENHGGLQQMGEAFAKGMVLVLSVWDDYAANMLWLDSDYPTDADASSPGVARGTCATTSGVPADVESSEANDSVTFSNIRFGPIGSTFSSSGSGSSGGSSGGSGGSPSSTASAPAATQTKYGQW
ncbi:cellobiohydrolaseI [Dentipellis sp. KUC8613]|nr:cellobiohydrolaseI [Dentipellis sp. KUC8613]